MDSIEKNKLIKKEILKLNRLFQDIEEHRKQSLKSLIQNCAFMSVTLSELQEDINVNGYIERYQNGANQSGIKESSSIKIYNALIKNYNASMKQLFDQIPEEEKSSMKDDFDNFLKQR